MDRRLYERIPAHLPATLTNLATNERASESHVANISQAGICVVSPCQFVPGAIVKLEAADSVLFGHIVYSTSEGAVFRHGIEVARVLIGETDLASLLNAMLVEAIPATPGVRETGC